MKKIKWLRLIQVLAIVSVVIGIGIFAWDKWFEASFKAIRTNREKGFIAQQVQDLTFIDTGRRIRFVILSRGHQYNKKAEDIQYSYTILGVTDDQLFGVMIGERFLGRFDPLDYKRGKIEGPETTWDIMTGAYVQNMKRHLTSEYNKYIAEHPDPPS
jgi:hypothetical protein